MLPTIAPPSSPRHIVAESEECHEGKHGDVALAMLHCRDRKGEAMNA